MAAIANAAVDGGGKLKKGGTQMKGTRRRSIKLAEIRCPVAKQFRTEADGRSRRGNIRR